MKILFKTQLWSFVLRWFERSKIDWIINHKYCQQIELASDLSDRVHASYVYALIDFFNFDLDRAASDVYLLMCYDWSFLLLWVCQTRIE